MGPQALSAHVADGVPGGRHKMPGAQPLQDCGVELVGELAAHLDDLPGAAVVAKGARHLLVGHGFAVALAPAPALSKLLLVLGHEVERSGTAVCPLDGVHHVGIVQGLVKVLEEAQLLAA